MAIFDLHREDGQAYFATQTAEELAGLTVADALHAHTADALTLTTGSVLSLADATHAHTADEFTLSSALALTLADALHAHTTDATSLSTGVLWTPSQITTQLWFDAADTSSVTTVSSAVSQWNDKSGNARHVTQGTAAKRPGYPSAALNGYNVVRFDGADDGLGRTSGIVGLGQATGAICMFMVAKPDAIPASDGVLGYISTTSTATRNNSAIRATTGGLGVGARRLDADAGVSFSDSTNLAGAAHILGTVTDYANSDAYLYSDGSLLAYNASYLTDGVTSNTTPAYLSVGANGPLTGNFFDGDIAEVIVTHSVDTTQRQIIEGYLAHKWGLTANLPSDHPYKSSPPLASSAYSLIVADAAHAHLADALALSAALSLLVNDALHAHLADATTLDTGSSSDLSLVDATHAHTADSVALSAALALLVSDAAQDHTANTVTLSSALSLAVANALQGHTAELVDIAQGLALDIVEAFQAHAAEGVALDTALALAVDDALQAHSADLAPLTAALNLVVADALQAHSAEQLVMAMPLPLADLLRKAIFARLTEVFAQARIDHDAQVVRVPSNQAVTRH